MLLVQTSDAQSLPVVHAVPSRQSGAHVALQCPLVQGTPAAHDVPHVPQLWSSVAVSTQRPLQSVAAPPQAPAQVPLEQTCELGQTVPHAPQFSGSRPVSAQ